MNHRERKKAVTAVILVRVSSKEQEEGYSLDAQEHRLNEYCLRKGLKIIKVFRFSESSTVGERKKFKETIEFAKKQKDITAVVVDKVDRLQRGFREMPLLNDLIEKEKIELHFYVENSVMHKYSTSNERFMWNINVTVAQNHVDNLRENVNRSIAQKLRSGEWISAAPIGYMHVRPDGRRDKGRSDIVLDKMRAPLIRRLFEEYATGAYTISQMVKKTKEWGLKNSRGNQGYLSKGHIHSIICNPFYYGVMRVKKTGAEYPHIYEPIISEELFDQCQNVRKSWNKKPFKWGGKEYIFRGLIKCATTGRVVTALTKSRTYNNGNTGEWTYLRCWNPDNPEKNMYIKEEDVLEQVQRVFDTMHLDKELLEKVVEVIKQSHKTEKDYRKQKVKELNSEHTKAQNKLDRLTDLFLEGVFDEKEYREKRKQLEEKRTKITQELESNDRADSNFAKGLNTILQLASKAGETFRGSTESEKRELINIVFWNLELRGQKLEFTLHSPFDMFVKSAKNGEWRALEDSNPRPTD